jgi:peptidoglycan/LPS O-acetylase OafA/YrhL
VTSYGYLAVDFFFIMSGFILMHVHHGDFRTLTWDRIRTFLILRWWRTYPVHIGAFVLALLVTTVSVKNLPTFGKALQSLLFFDTWSIPGGDINTPLWSLQVEWIGYLAFPFLTFVIVRIGHRTALAAITVLSCVGMAVLVANNNFMMNAFTLPLSFCRMATGFVCGCLLWSARGRLQLRRLYISDLSMVAAFACIVLVLLYAYPLFSFPFMLVAISRAAQPGPLTSAILTNKFALFLGRISFSLYLCHYPILRWVHIMQPSDASSSVRLLYDAGALLLIAPLATALCIFLEEPARRYGRSLSRRAAVPKAQLAS